MEVAEDVPEWVFGDSVRLNQILLNLGSNAIKFTPKGEIQIQVLLLSITDDKHLIRFRVKDDGIGIEPDKIERIFDRFEQAEKYTSRQFGGTGLGLTITEKLVKLMGGKIYVESEPKKGAIFTVELPFEPNSEVKPDAIKTEIQNAPNLKAARVLLVEDNNINVMLASRLLKMWGAQFDIAENGLEALDLLKSKDFDLVLLDIQMPIMNGFELIEKIRSKSIRPEISELPVIALTADAFDETRLRASELGFSDFITKPIKSGDLYQKMSRLLG
jgi:CheY-like chemotaxis protein/anti-sigma regulatory factor (Ser/Thr protein kinase)